jgi:hypothetical protein
MEKPVEPLELPLWEILQAATVTPDEADLQRLLTALDAALSTLDTIGQLQVAAEAIQQIVQIFQDRSTLTFEELEATNDEDGPTMPDDAFDRYVRQTMEVDFEQFIEPAGRLPRNHTDRESVAEGDSVVGELDKTTVLQILTEQMSQEPTLTEAEIFNQTVALAHDEDVSAWAGAIAQWMAEHQVSVTPLLKLHQAIEMPLAQLWIALLLGGYAMEQRGEFYETEHIWVSGR